MEDSRWRSRGRPCRSSPACRLEWEPQAGSCVRRIGNSRRRSRARRSGSSRWSTSPLKDGRRGSRGWLDAQERARVFVREQIEEPVGPLAHFPDALPELRQHRFHGAAPPSWREHAEQQRRNQSRGASEPHSNLPRELHSIEQPSRQLCTRSSPRAMRGGPFVDVIVTLRQIGRIECVKALGPRSTIMPRHASRR